MHVDQEGLQNRARGNLMLMQMLEVKVASLHRRLAAREILLNSPNPMLADFLGL